jgi:hypothetical protein
MCSTLARKFPIGGRKDSRSAHSWRGKVKTAAHDLPKGRQLGPLLSVIMEASCWPTALNPYGGKLLANSSASLWRQAAGQQLSILMEASC